MSLPAKVGREVILGLQFSMELKTKSKFSSNNETLSKGKLILHASAIWMTRRFTSGSRRGLQCCSTGIGAFILRPWAYTPHVLFFVSFLLRYRKAPIIHIELSELVQSEHIWVASTPSKKHQHPRRPPHALPDISTHSSHPTRQGHHHHKSLHHCVVG